MYVSNYSKFGDMTCSDSTNRCFNLLRQPSRLQFLVWPGSQELSLESSHDGV